MIFDLVGQSNRKYTIIVAIILLPLFFINVKDSHDWGDDFAQYLIQARNITEGRPQTDNGLLKSESDPDYAIQAYPVGFPLMLTPVYSIFKLDILPYCILISLLLFATGILIFEFFRKRTDALTAMIITLLFCYNANVIDLKKQILSEIPFTCIMFLLLFLSETSMRNKKYTWLIFGGLLSLMISTRLAGISVLVGYALHKLNESKKINDGMSIFKDLLKLTLTILTALILFIILNGVLFPISPGGLFHFYASSFHEHNVQLFDNLNFYYSTLKYLFPFFGTWIPSGWVVIALCGFIMRFIKSPSIMEFVFPLYLLIILFYPYTNAGLRFLIPILPMLIYYTYHFFNTIFGFITVRSIRISTAILLVILLASPGPLIGFISSQSKIEDGPQQKVSQELFAYLKSTPEDAALVFCKARAISLYTGRHSLYTIKNLDAEDVYNQFSHYKYLYLIIGRVMDDNEIYDPTLLELVSMFGNKYERVWENEHFDVYRQL